MILETDPSRLPKYVISSLVCVGIYTNLHTLSKQSPRLAHSPHHLRISRALNTTKFPSEFNQYCNLVQDTETSNHKTSNPIVCIGWPGHCGTSPELSRKAENLALHICTTPPTLLKHPTVRLIFRILLDIRVVRVRVCAASTRF